MNKLYINIHHSNLKNYETNKEDIIVDSSKYETFITNLNSIIRTKKFGQLDIPLQYDRQTNRDLISLLL